MKLTVMPHSGAETLASAVYRKLRREIITAKFPRGQKLRTQELCERYGTGLSPIREALNRLAVKRQEVVSALR